MSLQRSANIQQILKKAKKAAKLGDSLLAKQLYSSVLQTHPKHPVAEKKLRQLLKKYKRQPISNQKTDPSSDHIDALRNLYLSGQTQRAEKISKEILQIYPKSLIVLTILGATLRTQTRFDEAIKIFNRAIEIKPDFAEVYNYLGITFMDLQRLEEAVCNFDKAIKIKSDYAEAYNNLGCALRELGQIEDAAKKCEKAIKIKPEYAEAHNNCGIAFKDLGQLEKALKKCSKAIQINPNYAEAYNNRGIVLRELGHLDQAIENYDKAIQFKPYYAEAYNNRGIVLRDLGRIENAIESYENAIRLRPDFAKAYNNLGKALADIGQLEEAIECFNKAILLKPDYRDAFHNKGVIFISLGKLAEAIENCKQAIRIEPDCADAYNSLGIAFGDMGKLQDAVEKFNTAIKLKPKFAEAYNNLGNAFNDLGMTQKAIENYNKALSIRPSFAEAHRNLSFLKTYNINDPQIHILESLLLNQECSEFDSMHLYFALAKVYDDLHVLDKSFGYVAKGNLLRKKELNYHIRSDRKIITKIIKIFSGEDILNYSINSNSRLQPIFIVGMPRSGTTLVEQIIASHSKVHGAGELEELNKLAIKNLFRIEKSLYKSDTKQIEKDLRNMGESYLNSLYSLQVPEKIITDKMPLNFRWIGLIFLLFPDAKVIHVNRDARATCWSIYKTLFSKKGNGYSYDMADLAEFYNLYADLMDFWRGRFPHRIYELCYEKLTEEQEQETHSLLSYCGLEMEKSCLDFHKNKRAVKTASANQVREKMYKGSSDAWRKYEKYIQPLISKLPR